MSRKSVCDACDTEYDGYPPMIQVHLPGDDAQSVTVLDVCDAECLKNLAGFLAGIETEEQESRSVTVPAQEPERIIPPVSDPVFRPRSEQDVEDVTGVVRRGSHSS